MSSKVVGRNFYVTRGDTFTKEITFTSNDVPVNITGATVYFTAKLNPAKTDAQAEIRKVITNLSDPLNGKFTLTLDSTDLSVPVGIYFFDMQIEFINGTRLTFWPSDPRIQSFLYVQQDITLN